MKKMLKFPNLKQFFNYDCGACAMMGILDYYGIEAEEREIIKIAGTNSKTGTSFEGFKKVAKKFGFKCRIKQLTIDDLKKSIDKKQPVIICLQAYVEKKKPDWKKEWKFGHYAVAIGYDSKKMYFVDPGILEETYISFAELDKRWHDKEARKKFVHMSIVFYGKKPKYNPEKAVHMP